MQWLNIRQLVFRVLYCNVTVKSVFTFRNENIYKNRRDEEQVTRRMKEQERQYMFGVEQSHRHRVRQSYDNSPWGRSNGALLHRLLLAIGTLDIYGMHWACAIT